MPNCKGKFMLKIFVLASLFTTSLMAAEPPESTLRPDFVAKVQLVAEKVFTGKTPEGRQCSAIIKRFVNKIAFSSDTYLAYEVFAISGQLPMNVINAKSDDDASTGFFNEDLYHTSAGWCEGCGASWNDGRVSGFGKKLEFYRAGQSPQSVLAIVDVDSNKKQISRVRFQEYADWYIPGVWTPKNVVFDCRIAP